MNLLDKFSIDELSSAIIRNLDDKYLKKIYLSEPERNNVTGHCYLASEVFYHLTGGKEKWTPQVGHDGEGTHWWLKDKHSNTIVDVTSSQYTDFGQEPPYETGKGCGFQQISNNCKIVMEKVITDLLGK